MAFHHEALDTVIYRVTSAPSNSIFTTLGFAPFDGLTVLYDNTGDLSLYRYRLGTDTWEQIAGGGGGGGNVTVVTSETPPSSTPTAIGDRYIIDWGPGNEKNHSEWVAVGTSSSDDWRFISGVIRKTQNPVVNNVVPQGIGQIYLQITISQGTMNVAASYIGFQTTAGKWVQIS